MARTTEMKVTPELAREWLALDHPNRPVRPWKVDQITSDISLGLWEMNGESVKHCGEHGGLLDGKHRALGVVRADRPILSVVVFGLPCRTQHTMDIGSARSPGNAFALEGAPRANLVAAATRIIWRIENDLEAETGPKSAPTRRQLLATWERHPSIAQSIVWGDRLRSIHLSEATSVAAHYWLNGIDSDTAERYFGRLADGVGLVKGSPELAVRRWLATSAASRGRAVSAARLSVVIDGWNSLRLGQPRDIVRYRADRPFPKAV